MLAMGLHRTACHAKARAHLVERATPRKQNQDLLLARRKLVGHRSVATGSFQKLIMMGIHGYFDSPEDMDAPFCRKLLAVKEQQTC